jgi:hypothetical protein
VQKVESSIHFEEKHVEVISLLPYMKHLKQSEADTAVQGLADLLLQHGHFTVSPNHEKWVQAKTVATIEKARDELFDHYRERPNVPVYIKLLLDIHSGSPEDVRFRATRFLLDTDFNVRNWSSAMDVTRLTKYVPSHPPLLFPAVSLNFSGRVFCVLISDMFLVQGSPSERLHRHRDQWLL